MVAGAVTARSSRACSRSVIRWYATVESAPPIGSRMSEAV